MIIPYILWRCAHHLFTEKERDSVTGSFMGFLSCLVVAVVRLYPSRIFVVRALTLPVSPNTRLFHSIEKRFIRWQLSAREIEEGKKRLPLLVEHRGKIERQKEKKKSSSPKICFSNGNTLDTFTPTENRPESIILTKIYIVGILQEMISSKISTIHRHFQGTLIQQVLATSIREIFLSSSVI